MISDGITADAAFSLRKLGNEEHKKHVQNNVLYSILFIF
jgi:hypothetical protein